MKEFAKITMAIILQYLNESSQYAVYFKFTQYYMSNRLKLKKKNSVILKTNPKLSSFEFIWICPYLSYPAANWMVMINAPLNRSFLKLLFTTSGAAAPQWCHTSFLTLGMPFKSNHFQGVKNTAYESQVMLPK